MSDLEYFAPDEIISRHVIPAHPGIEMIDVIACVDDDGTRSPELERLPVVAWVVTVIRMWHPGPRRGDPPLEKLMTRTEPVCPEHANELRYMKFADGRIIEPVLRDWNSEWEFMESRWKEIEAEEAEEETNE